MQRDFELVGTETLFQGFFRVERRRFRHSLFGGGMSPVLERELLQRGDAAAVIVYDPRRDAVVLVEQFRVGALDAPGGPWLLEVIAGMIEQGESPDEVARREAWEEAGCCLEGLQPIASYLSSPGNVSERVWMYCALVDTQGLHGGVHGCADENEDILVHVVPFREAWQMLLDGHVQAAMPIIALQWLALNRERLRGQWRDGDAGLNEGPRCGNGSDAG